MSKGKFWSRLRTLDVLLVSDGLVSAQGGELVAGRHLVQRRRRGGRAFLGEVDQPWIDR